MTATVVNYMLRIFERNINPEYPKGIKIYLKETKDIDKESDKLDISVSNTKDIIDYFLIWDNKYVLVSLAFMVETSAVPNNIFMQVEHIKIADINYQAYG